MLNSHGVTVSGENLVTNESGVEDVRVRNGVSGEKPH